MNTNPKRTLIAASICSILLLSVLVAACASAQTSTSVSANNGTSGTRNSLAQVSRFNSLMVPTGFNTRSANRWRTNPSNRISTNAENLASMIGTTLGGLIFPNGTAQKASTGGPLFIVTHDE